LIVTAAAHSSCGGTYAPTFQAIPSFEVKQSRQRTLLGLQLARTIRKFAGMTRQMPLLVFTDLDGTLLSHTDYEWEAARPALVRLAHVNAGVVLASSKTAAEITVLRNEMGLQHWPAIVENGAGRLDADATDTGEQSSYLQLRAALDDVPAFLRSTFQGFGDMSEAQVSDLTGLSPAQARLAMQRRFSEPGMWSGSPEQRAEFLAALSARGVTAREGGRFLTLSFGATKADQMAQIIAELAPRHTVALGDAPNDVEMLEAADYGFLVANPHRDPLPILEGEKSGQISRTTRPGPEGWNLAMLQLLDRLNL